MMGKVDQVDEPTMEQEPERKNRKGIRGLPPEHRWIRVDLLNLTEWGPRLKEIFRGMQEGTDITMLSEHRTKGARFAQTLKEWRKAGFRPFAMEADDTGPGDKSTSAGVAILGRHHLTMRSPKGEKQLVGSARWTSAELFCKRFGLLFVVSYFRDPRDGPKKTSSCSWR